MFIPTNNGLPEGRADITALARSSDSMHAAEYELTVVRADVAGHRAGLLGYGSSAITSCDGKMLQSAKRLEEDLLVASLPNVASRINGAPA